MIKKLKHHYQQISKLNRILWWIAIFWLGLILAFKAIYAADLIPFQDTLPTMFSSWFDSGYYSNVHFNYWGNNFIGIIFWQENETGYNEPITINGWTQTIRCTEKLRGIYYNNQRGRRVWPLDTGNLQILQNSPFASWYGDMTITNGFFTNCTGVSWGWYSPLPNEVYGQIDHTLGTQTGFRMIAWVNYNYTGNAIAIWTQFAPTLTIATWWIHNGHIFDSNGGIAELSMNMPWCQSFQSIPTTQPIIIEQGSGIQFLCAWQNVNGYILSIGLSWSTSPFYNNIAPQTGASQRRLTGQTLTAGDYRATCTVMGQGGWLGGPQCESKIPFHVWGAVVTPPAWTGCNPNFQWEITFSSYNGSTVINPSLGTYITNSTGINLQWAATEPNITSITWDFTLGHISWIYTGTNIFTHLVTYPIQLLSTTGWNNFVSSYTTTWSSGLCIYTDAAKRVYVDIVPPTAPVIITPTSGANICPSTLFPITRSPSWDSGSNISHYVYEIYTNSGMINGNVMSWTTTSTGVSVNISSLALWTYYIRVLAVDNVGISSPSTTVSFTTSSQYCGGGTGIVIVTPTIWLRNVDLDKVYRSDPIWILGLTWPTLVQVSKWMLFINNATGGNGTTGMVTSSDTIYIEMVSSDEYDTTVSSQLNILGLTWTFSVTTKNSNCSLSTTEKLIIQNIYAELKDEYNNDLSKYSDFLNTFQSMVEDEADMNNNCNLDYLLSLIEDDFGEEGVDTSNHITPNCKEYSIGYDTTQKAYYAPEMMNRYYFINRESLIRHLDYYNPGDCHINTYGNNFRTSDTTDPMRHIAPNGKLYHLIGQYGGYSATEFITAKYFDSMESIVRYIDLKNPAKEIWKHTIDTSFTPIVYAAPNGKEYKIYKTDRWYMSYKLMKVKYYTTLSELKTHINKNNPSKR